MNKDTPFIQCKNISKEFSKNGISFKAVDSVDLSIYKGECYGLVGESGSGKSTLSSIICNLLQQTSGTVQLEGTDTRKIKLKDFTKKCQIIFQDPYSSLNPKMKIKDIIEEPLKIHKIGKSSQERKGLVNEMRTLVGLPPDCLEKYPSQLSGGQRQRVSIASAMILKPEFVICDECVSSLDVLIQNQILNLLKSMQKNFNLTFLFISHNLNVIAYMADRIGVMCKGKIIEENTTDLLLKNCKTEYTRNLLQAAGLLDEL